MEQRQKKEKQRLKTQHNLEQTRDTIEAGEHFHNIGFLAKIYFGDFPDVDQSLPPVERLCETIGHEYVDMALSGFAALLNRDDLPTPYDVALLCAHNKPSPSWWHAVLAGINEAWLRQEKSLQNFSNDLLKSALAIATELPVNSEGDQDRQWLPQLLTERPDIVEYVYEEIARTQLQHKKIHITVLDHLQHNEETKIWRSRVTLNLLKQFSCCSLNSLKLLALAGSYEPNYRDALIQQAQHGIMSCYGKQKEVWLVIAFLLKPADYSNALKAYSTRHKDIVRLLRDMGQRAVIQETDKPLQFSISQLEYCILITGRAFNSVSRTSKSLGDQEPWDAAGWVWDNINKLAADPTSKSTESLQRLLAEESLSSYHDYLRHSLASQAVVRREAEFRQPSWKETVEALKGGKPANIADLHALVFDQLLGLQKEIQHTNTDPYKAFWRCDSNGKVDTPEIEDVCRDRLIDLLKPSLSPLDLHVEPEGHMAADKRSDIQILGPGGMRLPIELKRDFHKDVWTACENQLERMYSRDPGAAGYGIYGVFWFGDRRTTKMKKPPAGIATPQSAEELEKALQSLVPVEQQEKIRVMVFDVTPPY